MDIFDFEELISDMLDITDEQREDDDYIATVFFEKFDIEFDAAYQLTKQLLFHTPKVQAALSRKLFHAFISKNDPPCMLMKVEAKIS